MLIKFIDRSKEESAELDGREYVVEAKGYKIELPWFNTHKDLGTFLNTHPPYSVPFGLEPIREKEEEGRRVIDLKYLDAEGLVLGWIIAQKCVVFIMNDQGKTIERYRAH
ncbi:hypothetical protein LCGC14_2227130 [marine sediment metagenome]|uniref:Uncharacterized protein n=1 Tax=marine sediment metagenome TaxID=412755 RepID=A0A0F9D9G5_9ZZZZ